LIQKSQSLGRAGNSRC